jgi:hypothetical protein
VAAGPGGGGLQVLFHWDKAYVLPTVLECYCRWI